MTHAFDLAARVPGFELAARASWSAPCAALFGASGSGKTTIIEAIAGARPDVRGSITINGRRVDGTPAAARGFGWVPQDAALFPHMTAAENVAFGLARSGDASSLHESLEIAPLAARRARDLSGGERQRVALARALATRPSFLLLDEPLASLDRPLRARIVPFLASIPERLGIPMLLVTHDPLEVLALASHVMVIESGRIVAEGDPRSVFTSAATLGPLHALGAENVFAVTPSASDSPGIVSVSTPAGLVLHMAAAPGFPAPTRVAIRSEDIILATSEPRGLSAQNILPGRPTRLDPADGHVTVSVHGEELQVKLTSRARASLGLAVGQDVFLVIKAHAVLPC